MPRLKNNRDIGREILDGIRQLKRGDIGRVTHIPPIAEVRERVGVSQSEFSELSINREGAKKRS